MPDSSNALTVQGTYSSPHLSLTLAFEDMNLTATVGETDLTGTVNGSGFLNASVTLARQ